MVIYVSVCGNDRWSGTLDLPNAAGTDGPLATLTGARNAIRRLWLAGGLRQPVEVQIRGGVYRISEPLRLSPGDSGTEHCPITYCAYPGERPVISGGQPISGWKPFKDGIVCADLPDVRPGLWRFDQLFYNGARMLRSRRPKRDPANPLYGGWSFVEGIVPENEALGQVQKVELGLSWRFRTDPRREGVDQGWFSPGADDSGWAELTAQQPWQLQGFPSFHGTAWYRSRFTVPEGFDAKKYLWMLFGAIDKEGYVYIDGQMVFEHTTASTGLSVDVLWDQPFMFDVRPYLKPGVEHTIAVRVDSPAHQGGIKRGVSLVSSDADLPADVLAGQVEAPVAFSYAPEDFPQRWNKPEQGQVFVILGKGWVNDIVPIKRVDFQRNVIYLSRVGRPFSQSLSQATRLLKGNRFYVENMLEDLTEPGEWCLDNETGTVYFKPPDGDFNPDGVTAPATDSLIRMTGSIEHPLRYVNVRGLTFTQTLSGFPNEHVYYKTPNAAQAVYMENTEHCQIADNLFDAVGGDAIRLQNANAHNTITGNEIACAGAYGISLGSYQKGFARHDTSSGDVPSPPEWHTHLEDREPTALAWPKSRGHLIANNHIHHVGVYEKHACGIVLFGISSVDIAIRNNLIHNTPRFGIGLLSGFGRVAIEYNDLHNLSEETCDTGGICFNRWYVWEGDPELAKGCIVRFNRIRDVIGCGAYGEKAEPGGTDHAGGRIWAPYYSWAIYFDNAPMDVLVYGNICARNTLGGIMISHYGKNVTVENNIFVESSRSQAYMLFAGPMSGIAFRRNIFAYWAPDADFMRLNLAPSVDIGEVFSEFDHNIYCPPPGRQLTFSGSAGEAVKRVGMAVAEGDLTLEQWHALGFDHNSIDADPLFVDPAGDDFRLQPGSPALKLGFQPIDVDEIGPRR